jgi:hypothetical protein
MGLVFEFAFIDLCINGFDLCVGNVYRFLLMGLWLVYELVNCFMGLSLRMVYFYGIVHMS